jgi:hypothetical protein
VRKCVAITQDGAVLPCRHLRCSDVGEGEFMKGWWESEVFVRFRAQEDDAGSVRGLSLPVAVQRLPSGGHGFLGAVFRTAAPIVQDEPFSCYKGASSSRSCGPTVLDGAGRPLAAVELCKGCRAVVMAFWGRFFGRWPPLSKMNPFLATKGRPRPDLVAKPS